MESLLNNNMEVIRRVHPQLNLKLSQQRDVELIEVIDSRNGEKVPVVVFDDRRIYIHSRFDPFKEAERFIDGIDPAKFDLFIVFGFGFGYHIEVLIKKMRKYSTLLVLEKSSEMLMKAATFRKLVSLFQDDRIRILVDPLEDDLATALKGKSSYRVSFFTHRGSFQIDPNYYNNLKRIAKSYLSLKDVNIATLSKFEKTWSANISRNIQQYVFLSGANIFYNKFRDIPAVVVGAGPSLKYNMEYLRNNQNRLIIIAVDTSYKILLRNRIEPHFCLSVDPQVINARYFEGVPSGKTIMVADPTVHPSVFRFFKGKTVITGVVFQMMKWIEEVAGDKGELSYGGSVSTNAYDFAKKLGASPIMLIGHDLSFTDSLAHVRGSYLDEQVFIRINRFYNSLMFNRSQLYALPAIYVKGIKSERVHTNQKMMIFISWFEKRKDQNLINSSSDGAFLSGVKYLPLEDVLLNDPPEDIFSEIYKIYNSSVLSFERSNYIRKGLFQRCEKMLKELDLILPLLVRAISLSKDLQNIVQSENRDQGRIDYILKRLSEVDKILKSKETIKDVIGVTIQRVIHTITEGYKIIEKDETVTEDELVAKKSIFLYEGLLEGTQFNIKILKKMKVFLTNS